MPDEWIKTDKDCIHCDGTGTIKKEVYVCPHCGKPIIVKSPCPKCFGVGKELNIIKRS